MPGVPSKRAAGVGELGKEKKMKGNDHAVDDQFELNNRTAVSTPGPSRLPLRAIGTNLANPIELSSDEEDTPLPSRASMKTPEPVKRMEVKEVKGRPKQGKGKAPVKFILSDTEDEEEPIAPVSRSQAHAIGGGKGLPRGKEKEAKVDTDKFERVPVESLDMARLPALANAFSGWKAAELEQRRWLEDGGDVRSAEGAEMLRRTIDARTAWQLQELRHTCPQAYNERFEGVVKGLAKLAVKGGVKAVIEEELVEDVEVEEAFGA